MSRDRIARWERGRATPRNEWRQWLAVVLGMPKAELDMAAEAAHSRSWMGHAAVAAHAPTGGRMGRGSQGSPALLPVFRSRVQAGILAATLLNPNRAFNLTELADYVGGSLASVSKESDILEAVGILTRRDERSVRLVQAVTDRPMIGPLTDLIRVTYGLPQIVGEELSRVPGITRITAVGEWAERFAGVSGPEAEAVELRLTTSVDELDEVELEASVSRASKRINRDIRYTVVSAGCYGPQTAPERRDHRPLVDIAVLTPRAGQATFVDPWSGGEEVIKQLLSNHQLELVSGIDACSAPFFEMAGAHLEAAEHLEPTTASSAFLLICHAAQLIAGGLLARQGLRVAAGAAATVANQAVVAQFGTEFSHIELLRQRAVGLRNPTSRDNRATVIDVADYLPAVRGLLDRASALAPQLGIFT